MKKYLMLALLSAFSPLLGEPPVCHKCELNREYNKQHPGDYEYYEDYLKDNEGKVKAPPATQAPQK
jgi:hypothetical protein